jgi:hypothetical protein
VIKARRSSWPPELGPDTAVDRARVISCGWRDLAITLATADLPLEQRQRMVAAVEAHCHRVGEGGWQIPSPAPTRGAWLTRADVAVLAGVRPTAVSDWSSRGLVDPATGKQRKLPRFPEGYHPDQVTAFLEWRKTARPDPRREKTFPCAVRPVSPPARITGPAQDAAIRSTVTP